MQSNSFKLVLLFSVAAVLAACSQAPTFEGNLTGRVLAADGGPFAGATVTAASTSESDGADLRAQALDAGRTDDEGYFDLMLPAGRYVLMIVGDGYGLTRVVEVTNERVELDMRAQRLGHVRGAVVARDGGTADGVQIRVRDTNRSALTTAAGDYVVHGLPAGEYRLTAVSGEGTYVPEVPVTVAAGQTVEAPALELPSNVAVAPPAPTIAATSSDFMLFGDYNGVLDQAVRLELTGSGFGDRMGLNRLLYAGIEVDAQAIASWSDSTIVLETAEPLRLLGGGYLPRGLGAATLDAQAQLGPRFEVRTEAGTATSEPVRLARVDVHGFGSVAPDTEAEIEVYAQDVFGSPLDGLEFTLAANRGTLASSAVTIGADRRARVGFTPESHLPHVISVSYGDEVVTTGSVQCCHLVMDAHHVPAGESASVTVVVERYDGTAAGEGVTFDVVLWSWYYGHYIGGEDTAIDLGSYTTGKLSDIVLDLSGLTPSTEYGVFLVQDGRIVGDDGWLYLQDPLLD